MPLPVLVSHQKIEHMCTGPSADAGPQTGTICSGDAISGTQDGLEHELGLAPQYQQENIIRDEAITYPTSPIHTLPNEILIRIFDLAHYLWRTTSTKNERVAWDRSVRNLMAVGYPELLSHVCSRWRKIVLSSPVLWTYLDLFTLSQSPQTFLNRCYALVPRSQDCELVFRIRLNQGETKARSDYLGMEEFCSSIAPRLRSLLLFNYTLSDSGLLSWLIQASLPNITPGKLTRLLIKTYGLPPISILTNPENIHGSGMVGWEVPSAETLGISQDLLDAILLPIVSLRLNGRFFPWSSPAYLGLVELHLQCTFVTHEYRPFIQAHQLRTILLGCPELHSFRINLNITGRDQALAPVPLTQLDELSLQGLSRSSYDTLLSLLAPGQKPLKFTFQTELVTKAPLYCATILSFFQRTNITGLFILGWPTSDQHLNLSQLLTESPSNLHTLGLDQFRLSELAFSHSLHLKALPPLRLSCLCLRKCMISPESLDQMNELVVAQVVKLHKPDLGEFEEDEALAREEITLAFPRVKWVHSTQDMELWNTWEVEYID